MRLRMEGYFNHEDDYGMELRNMQFTASDIDLEDKDLPNLVELLNSELNVTRYDDDWDDFTQFLDDFNIKWAEYLCDFTVTAYPILTGYTILKNGKIIAKASTYEYSKEEVFHELRDMNYTVYDYETEDLTKEMRDGILNQINDLRDRCFGFLTDEEVESLNEMDNTSLLEFYEDFLYSLNYY